MAEVLHGSPARPLSGAAGGTPGPRRRGWTTGPVAALISGVVLLLVATGCLVGAAALLWADQTQRDSDGYLWTADTELVTSRYAVTTEVIPLDSGGAQWAVDGVLGATRLEAVPTTADGDLFIGVADADDVAEYLRGVGHVEVSELGSTRPWAWAWMMRPAMTDRAGDAPAAAPDELDFWVAQASGPGPLTLEWQPVDGNWQMVLMRADGGAGVAADVRIAAGSPGLAVLAGGLVVAGLAVLVVGVLLVVLAVRKARTPLTLGTSTTPSATGSSS
ncbi:hypothetical protein [Blastococcus sp. VKM Ac-2987]|uniref:hypothetical protein n=1 Tax=Blastococcus sp. VKM Ac-2987 TaxID=3004141 RepID=UPI0022AB5742|nr:hypothetical protein [Blastococcus sp. VKM Ac-2987]MCZ2857456.1 hypothetical protein [Blastococcus sp. VKM Ac-2987]